MQIAMIGLGRMGANMALRLLRAGHKVVVWNRDHSKAEELVPHGAVAVKTIEELVQKLERPRAAWVMLPAGDVTDAMIAKLGELMSSGDTVIDGGNTYYKDDVRRSKALLPKGVHYVDCGTSGGVWGLERGYCLMIGGPKEAVTRLEPVFRTLAPGKAAAGPTPGSVGGTAEEGFLHCGPVGAGHFVKMIHNGIEYGVMQAYAEGFDILKCANKESLPADMRYDFELDKVSELWRRGSVIGSWLLDLTAIELARDPKLAEFSGVVNDSGEGRWTVQAAVEEAVPADVLTAALYVRFRSRQDHTYAEKVLSAMRKGFGGHQEPKKA